MHWSVPVVRLDGGCARVGASGAALDSGMHWSMPVVQLSGGCALVDASGAALNSGVHWLVPVVIRRRTIEVM